MRQNVKKYRLLHMKVQCKTPPLMLMQIRLLKKRVYLIKSLAHSLHQRRVVLTNVWNASMGEVICIPGFLPTTHSHLCLEPLFLHARLMFSCSRKRRNCVQKPDHIIWCHLTVLQAADLAALAQALQTERKFPALRVVDEKDVLLAVGVAD
jgi:hypothetical protein